MWWFVFFFKSEKYTEFVKYRQVNIVVLTFPFADIVDICALTAHAQLIISLY